MWSKERFSRMRRTTCLISGNGSAIGRLDLKVEGTRSRCQRAPVLTVSAYGLRQRNAWWLGRAPGSLSLGDRVQHVSDAMEPQAGPRSPSAPGPADDLRRRDQPSLEGGHHVGDLLGSRRAHEEMQSEGRCATLRDARAQLPEERDRELATAALREHLEARGGEQAGAGGARFQEARLPTRRPRQPVGEGALTLAHHVVDAKHAPRL